ncbi:hypothetical protein ABPG72_017279 [Tetrahymena utriculariae]
MFFQYFIPQQTFQQQNQLIQLSQPGYIYTYNQVQNYLPSQIYRTGISENPNGILSYNKCIFNQNKTFQNCQTQENQIGYSNYYMHSQFEHQQSYVQGIQAEKNVKIDFNQDSCYEHDSFKKEEQIDCLEVKINKQDLDANTLIQVRTSFSTELIDRNGFDRNHLEIISSIGNKTFQTKEIQMEVESSDDKEEQVIQSLQNSQCYSQIALCQNIIYDNHSSQLFENASTSSEKINEQKLIQGYSKKQFLNCNIFLENLKQEFHKFYGIKDNEKLIHQIHYDLTSKGEERKSGEFTQKSTLNSKQNLDNQLFAFKQCVYVNLNSEISQQFINYCGRVNLNSINQNKQRVVNAQLENSYINRDDNNYQINFSYNSNSCEHQNKLIYSKYQQSTSSVFKEFFYLKPKSISFLKCFDFSEIRPNKPKKTSKIRNKIENSSYVKNSQFHNLNKLFMYNILSMFRKDALKNLNLSEIIIQELTKIIQRLKISSQRRHRKQSQGFYNYFTHSHYNILFLKINGINIYQIKDSPLDLDLHKQCFNIDFTNDVSEIEIAYINLMKEINFQIFMANIRENELVDDGTESKQNIRIKYTLKAINGIKKIAKGILIKKF